MFTMLNETTVQIERMDGSTFTLSADTQDNLFELLAMWQQPLETWNGGFKSAAQLQACSEDTVSVDTNTLKESA